MSHGVAAAAASAPPVLESLEPRRLLAGATEIDLTFGHVGTVRHKMGMLRGVIALPGGKVLAFGDDESPFATRPLIGRVVQMNADGSLDTTFGGSGTRRLTKFGVTAAAVQADGKILLAGHSADRDRIALARLNPDGSYDTTFGSNGVHVGAKLSDNNPSGSVAAITILPGGKIQLVVQSNKPDNSGVQVELFRYRANGRPDTTFGADGRQLLVDRAAVTRALALPDGRTIVAGHHNLVSGLIKPFILRVLDDGTIDNGFYSRALNERVGGFSASDIDLQLDGKLVVTVPTAVARLDVTGHLDVTFSDDGIVDLTDDQFSFGLHATAVQADGIIVTTGYVAGTGVYEQDGFYRFKPDGTPDQTFGPAGHITDPLDLRARWTMLLPIESGKLIAAAQYANPNWLFARYDDSPDVQLVGDTLYARGGDDGADTIRLAPKPMFEGGMASLTFNGVVTDYTRSAVKRFVVYGGPGNDAITLALDIPAHINAGAGEDDDTVTTAGGDDSIQSGGGTDVISSGGGNDTLSGGFGEGSFNAGDGNDLLEDLRGDVVDAGSGNDVLRQVSADTLRAGAGDDLLINTSGHVFGDEGNDDMRVFGSVSGTFDGGAGDDLIQVTDTREITDEEMATLLGGDGNDVLVGSFGNFLLNGGSGNDLLRAEAVFDPGDSEAQIPSTRGSDTLIGGEGNDTIFAGLGDDTIEGNAGNDLIYTGGGRNYAYGGGGTDRILGRGDFLDTLRGGDGNDHIDAGTSAFATLLGGNGDDHLTGGSLQDGGAGNDTFTAGGNRAARFFGGPGDDTFFTRDIQGDTLDGGDGTDTATVDEFDVLTSIENQTP